jgi:hypothetical protein
VGFIFWASLIYTNKSKDVQNKETRITRKVVVVKPLQVWTGPEDFKSLRFPDFKTIGT